MGRELLLGALLAAALAHAVGVQVDTNVPGMDFITQVIGKALGILAFAFWASTVFLIYYGVEAVLHPTPGGRSGRFGDLYEMAKRYALAVVGMYLALFVVALAISVAGGGGSPQQVALSVFQQFFIRPVAQLFT